jgi:RNA polymerase sigma-70 factor (ECF subfamily)
MSRIMRAAEPSHLGRAAERSNRAFEQLAEPLRRELKLHCYRMLGSLHEAEDAVQETYLRAWRSSGSFDGRGSFRAWLYRIATNACLDALAGRKHAQRLLPDQRAPATAEMPDGMPAADVAWLEPYPDSDLDGIADDAPNPEARYTSRQAVQLAFVAVIQQLPPRQRAVLLLYDVLGWSAAEAADLLGGSAASVNSTLQRARETLAKRYPDGTATQPPQQELLGGYLQAWEGRDLDGFVSLLKEDATYSMPPLPQWYAGGVAIGTFFGWAWKMYAGFRLVPTAANRQPAFAAYSRTGADGPCALTLFPKPAGPPLFRALGLPLVLPHGGSAEFLATRSAPT